MTLDNNNQHLPNPQDRQTMLPDLGLELVDGSHTNGTLELRRPSSNSAKVPNDYNATCGFHSFSPVPAPAADRHSAPASTTKSFSHPSTPNESRSDSALSYSSGTTWKAQEVSQFPDVVCNVCRFSAIVCEAVTVACDLMLPVPPILLFDAVP
ncbi:hypothetical protein AHF37_00807 [Paragonimus kellicotti]|nr:hypothetical protein AHF37_00807 [Paragonimus kellicotti]